MTGYRFKVNGLHCRICLVAEAVFGKSQVISKVKWITTSEFHVSKKRLQFTK
jgi:hypothetical protein